jgi:predicted cupin superfamily sugar epimerase
MHPRAQELIAALNLQPHPEGGWYAEVFRSEGIVTRHDDNVDRSALTTIYFLLAEGTYSRWHRVLSDEAWHFYEGDPLELITLTPGADRPQVRILGPVADGQEPVHVVLAREWQAARPRGAYTLVGCTVGPGFDFADFELIDGHDGREALLARFGDYSALA